MSLYEFIVHCVLLGMFSKDLAAQNIQTWTMASLTFIAFVGRVLITYFGLKFINKVADIRAAAKQEEEEMIRNTDYRMVLYRL